jgi:hypothetical protein
MIKPSTPSERIATYRQRKKAAGLVELRNRYVKPEWIPAIDELIKSLENRMSLQSQLNNAAFSQLPQVYAAMKLASGYLLGSMEQYTFDRLMKCSPCLDDMNEAQKTELDNDIIKTFRYREWI